IADPLALRIKAEQTRERAAQARQLEAGNELRDIQAKLAADPDRTYREALAAAETTRARILQRIDDETSTLVSPARMKVLLQDVLRTQARLKLIELESSSSPLALPDSESTKQPQAQPAPVVFYRHGLRLTLEGGYF